MQNKKPVKIIFDTDIGYDCDDAGTLAMLHRLCDKGEAELLAVTHCFSTPYVAGCIDGINRAYGREVPVGINYDTEYTDRGIYAGEICERFPNRYPAGDYKTALPPPETLTVLRKVLSEAADNSVTLVVTGKLGSMHKLLQSTPDDISPLAGKELIARKISRTVVMGGRFFESWPMTVYADGNLTGGHVVTWEWNIKYNNAGIVDAVLDEWPGELVFASYEIGNYIKTMEGYPARAGMGDPVALAYELHNRGAGRCSWDQTAMLEAVRPGKYWNLHAYGRISVDDELVTHWSPDPTCRHSYLLPKADYEDIRRVIDDLLDGV